MDNELLATAYHEAGHIVIADLLDIEILGVSVVPDPGKETLGHTSFAELPMPEYEPTASDRDFYVRRVMVSLSGYLSEKKFLGKKITKGLEKGADIDRHDALDFADWVTNGNTDESEEYIARLEIRVGNEIERCYPVIEALALELYERKTMTGDEIRESISCHKAIPRM